MIRVQPVQTNHREGVGDDGPQRVVRSQRATPTSASGATQPNPVTDGSKMAAVKPTFAACSTIAPVVVYETEDSGTDWDMMS